MPRVQLLGSVIYTERDPDQALQVQKANRRELPAQGAVYQKKKRKRNSPGHWIFPVNSAEISC